MSTSIIIDRSVDETISIYVEEELIVSANHDEHGWAGIVAVEDTARGIAEAFGLEVYEK